MQVFEDGPETGGNGSTGDGAEEFARGELRRGKVADRRESMKHQLVFARRLPRNPSRVMRFPPVRSGIFLYDLEEGAEVGCTKVCAALRHLPALHPNPTLNQCA